MSKQVEIKLQKVYDSCFYELWLRWEAVVRGCSVKNVFLEISQNSQENTCATVSFLIKLHAETRDIIKKETPGRVHSCELCKISKNTYCYWTSPVAASVQF